MHAVTEDRTAADDSLAALQEHVLEAIGRGVAAWEDATFDELALEAWRAQVAAVPAYGAWSRHALDDAGLEAPRTWREVPLLPIAAFRTLRVAPDGPDAITFRSSGTTSSSRGSHHLRSLAPYEAAVDAGVSAALVPDVAAGEHAPLTCIQLQPDASAAPDSSLTHMLDRVRSGPWCRDGGAWVDGGYRLDADGAWRALERAAAAGEPVLLLATSFALAMLLEATSGREPLALPPGSRVMDTGGFKGRTREVRREELLAGVHERLGVTPAWCENEYGMAELSSQGWLGTVAASAGRPLPGMAGRGDAHDPARDGRWMPPWTRLRVLDPATLQDLPAGAAEPGLVAVHDLASCLTCAAVRTEDLADVWARLNGVVLADTRDQLRAIKEDIMSIPDKTITITTQRKLVAMETDMMTP